MLKTSKNNFRWGESLRFNPVGISVGDCSREMLSVAFLNLLKVFISIYHNLMGRGMHEDKHSTHVVAQNKPTTFTFIWFEPWQPAIQPAELPPVCSQENTKLLTSLYWHLDLYLDTLLMPFCTEMIAVHFSCNYVFRKRTTLSKRNAISIVLTCSFQLSSICQHLSSRSNPPPPQTENPLRTPHPSITDASLLCVSSPSLLTHWTCGIWVPGPHSLSLSGTHSSNLTTSHSKQLGSSHGMASTRWGQFPIPPVGSLMILLFLSLKPATRISE